MRYEGETLAVDQELGEIQELAQGQSFRVESQTEIDGHPLLLLERTSRVANAPRVLISAGVHGDEPAPVRAIRDLLHAPLPDRFDYTIFPAINPSGLARNQRENAAGCDLNRAWEDRSHPEVRAYHEALGETSFDLALCLHEDWEAAGFYTYELKQADETSLGSLILETAQSFCGVDAAAEIDGRPAENGLITPPDSIEEVLAELPGLPEAIWLYQRGTPVCYTLETPSNRFPLSQRAACQVAIIRAVLDRFAAS